MFVEALKRRTASERFGGRWLQLVVRVGTALGLALGPALVSSKEGATRDARIALIRGLVREIGVTKVPLPRGKQGVIVNPQGKLDQAKASSALRSSGVAIRPGMPVEITRITFKHDRIVFDINGGGKSGKKWYQRIEIGMGTATTPIAPNSPVFTYGSYISLTFSGKVPELTVQEAKQKLSGVLDFERHSPTVLYSPSVPPNIKAAIEKHEVLVGMDRDAVLSSKGPPDRKVREVREGVEQEDWIYGLPPHPMFVTFDGDTVVGVRQY